ncbi:MAG: hypothetical protein ACMXYC_03945 [Candidatus Woesearchaeota archaeon]
MRSIEVYSSLYNFLQRHVDDFPYWRCDEAGYLVEQITGIQRVTGWFKQTPHVWNQQDDFIIDLSIRQFESHGALWGRLSSQYTRESGVVELGNYPRLLETYHAYKLTSDA